MKVNILSVTSISTDTKASETKGQLKFLLNPKKMRKQMKKYDMTFLFLARPLTFKIKLSQLGLKVPHTNYMSTLSCMQIFSTIRSPEVIFLDYIFKIQMITDLIDQFFFLFSTLTFTIKQTRQNWTHTQALTIAFWMQNFTLYRAMWLCFYMKNPYISRFIWFLLFYPSVVLLDLHNHKRNPERN